MKLLVSVDSDGHFHAAHLSDRKGVINLLHTIESGSFYSAIVNDNKIHLPSNLSSICCKDWELFVKNFLHVGFLEYVDITETAPMTCPSMCW